MIELFGLYADNMSSFSVEMSPVNLDRIQSWIDQGRLDPTKPITLKELADSRCIHGVKKDGVKVLAKVCSIHHGSLNATNNFLLKGSFKFKSAVNLIVSRASTTAIAAIEEAGGQVTTRYFTPLIIKKILRDDISLTPEDIATWTKPHARALPDPSSRKDIEYYRDPAHRGYLSHLIKEGEGPSLYFRPPPTEDKIFVRRKKTAVVTMKDGAPAVVENNRLF
jgi:large subunit ribosomal protein L15